ncbi:MAG: PepSY domain-containing protein [Oxalobacteraceae bacterium]
MKKIHFLMFAVMISFATGDLRAGHDDDDEHDRARTAMTAGQIMPLAEILGQVEQRYAGRVVKTELELHDGIWMYELKLLPANGRLYKLKINAQTGRVIGAKGQVQEKH